LAKADHPRVFVFLGAIKEQKTTEKHGWSAFADHDELGGVCVKFFLKFNATHFILKFQQISVSAVLS
jgi:hypothetical protein